ncbi:MAG: hypothetical protein RIR11_3199 [Bacteroidota bacterium]|jgi:hypothetical protein
MLLIFLQPFSKIWVYLSFKINQEVIAKTLCVNKEIKDNCCQGECYLKEQLNKLDKGAHNQVPSKEKLRLENLYYHTHIDLIFSTCTIVRERSVSKKYSNNFYAASYINDIFRPPKFI